MAKCMRRYILQFNLKMRVLFLLPGHRSVVSSLPEDQDVISLLSGDRGVIPSGNIMTSVCSSKDEHVITCDVGEFDERYKCPVREKPPYPPVVLPYEVLKENIPKLKKWIMDFYQSSALNQCTHQVFPLVNSLLPLNLMVAYSVKPTAVHKSAQFPLHFMDEVMEGLEKDMCLGVLEKVPQNTPTTW